MGFKQIISIHGVPRSGTSWLGQTFDSSPNVNYKYQPLFSYAFKDELDLNSNKNEMMKFFTKLYNYQDNFLDQIYNKDKGIYPKFERKKSLPEFLVIKMVRYHYLIPHFLDILNNIKFVFIVRHPCGVLNSWKNAPREFLNEWDFDEEWEFAQSMNKFRPEQYYGFNRWKEATKLFLEMEKNFPDRCILISYENFLQKPFDLSKKIFDFCDLEWNKQTKNFIENSTSINQDDVYSVYKGKKTGDEWKDNLKSKIVEKILKDLEGTEFERFIK